MILFFKFTPPLSFRDCFNNGKIDIMRYQIYCRRIERNEQDEYDILKLINSNSSKRKFKSKINSSQKKRLTKRSVKKHHLIIRHDDGSLRTLTYKYTLWYIIYVTGPP